MEALEFSLLELIWVEQTGCTAFRRRGTNLDTPLKKLLWIPGHITYNKSDLGTPAHSFLYRESA